MGTGQQLTAAIDAVVSGSSMPGQIPEGWIIGVSYSDVRRLGIYALSGYETPGGVYFYPVASNVDGVERTYETGLHEPPFAGGRTYRHVFAVEAPTEFDLALARSRANAALADRPDLAQERLRWPCPAGDVYSLAWAVAQADTSSMGWTWRFRRALIAMGLPVIADLDGAGFIHPNEPVQGIVLDPRVIQHAKCADNPHRELPRRPHVTPTIRDAGIAELRNRRGLSWEAAIAQLCTYEQLLAWAQSGLQPLGWAQCTPSAGVRFPDDGYARRSALDLGAALRADRPGAHAYLWSRRPARPARRADQPRHDRSYARWMTADGW